MTEIVLLYILTGITAAGLILSILLLQKYGAARAEIAALKTEQQRLAALQTEETRRSSQETAQMLQAMQTGIQTNLQTGMQAFGEMISSNQKDSAENLDKPLKIGKVIAIFASKIYHTFVSFASRKFMFFV